jgi:hypothetical protein
VTIGDIYGLPTTIRSMRTGSRRSAFIVLADSTSATIIRDSIPSLISACGVILVDVGAVPVDSPSECFRIRYHLLFDYLSINPYHFERFTMADAYDSFFQGDVFLDSVSPGTLYFATEVLTPRLYPRNLGWLRNNSAVLYEFILDLPIVSAAPIVGGVQPFLKFCRVLFGLKGWHSLWTSPRDQSYVNLIVEGGNLRTAGVTYEIVPNDGFISTVGYCDKLGELAFDANGNFACGGYKTTPMLVHQYGRPKSTRAQVAAVCPAGEIQWSFRIDAYDQPTF